MTCAICNLAKDDTGRIYCTSMEKFNAQDIELQSTLNLKVVYNQSNHLLVQYKPDKFS